MSDDLFVHARPLTYMPPTPETCDASQLANAAGAPLISVCMSVYNAERYVAEAVESILNQSSGDFEFLIIDDGSTDGSLQILRRYAARDARIRLTSRHNRGVAATLNELLGRARGEYIARMDADDIAMPHRLRKQADYLESHPECVMVGCRVWRCDEEGDPVGEYPTLHEHNEIDAFHFQMTGPALVHPSVMMRRDAVQAVGGYRGFHIEDIDLYLRLAERGRLARLPEFLLNYRVHSDNLSFTNVSSAFHERSYRELCEIVTDACRRRNLPVSLPPPEVLPEVPTPPSVERDKVWAWQALGAGHLHTARKYARRALAKAPLSTESWRLIYCAHRGY
jgi:glycosyltransferase involved in cell wall biosynthesis